VGGVDNVKNKQAVELLTEFKSRGITWEIKNGIITFAAIKMGGVDIMRMTKFTNKQLISAASKV